MWSIATIFQACWVWVQDGGSAAKDAFFRYLSSWRKTLDPPTDAPDAPNGTEATLPKNKIISSDGIVELTPICKDIPAVSVSEWLPFANSTNTSTSSPLLMSNLNLASLNEKGLAIFVGPSASRPSILDTEVLVAGSGLAMLAILVILSKIISRARGTKNRHATQKQLTEKLAHQAEQLSAAQAEKAACQSEVDALKIRGAQLEADIETGKKDATLLCEELVAANASLIQAKEELTAAEDSYKNGLEAAAAQKVGKKEEIKKLSLEKKSALESALDKERALDRALKDQEKSQKYAQKLEEELSRESTRLAECRGKLQGPLSDIESLNAQLQAKESHNQDLVKNHHTAVVRSENLQAAVVDRDQQISQLQTEVGMLKNQLHSQQMQVRRLVCEKEEAQEMVAGLQKKSADQNSQIAQQRGRISQDKASMEALEVARGKDQLKIEDMKRQEEDGTAKAQLLKGELQRHQDTAREANDRTEKAETTNRTLVASNAEEVARHVQKNEAQAAQLTELYGEIATLKTINNSLESKQITTSKGLVRAQQALADERNAAILLQRRLQGAELQLSQCNHELDQTRQDLDRTILDRNTSQVQGEADKLLHKALQNDQVELKSRLEQLQGEHIELQKHSNQQLLEYTDKLQKCHDLGKYRTLYESGMAGFTAREAVVEDFRSKNANLEGEISILQTEKSNLVKKLKETRGAAEKEREKMKDKHAAELSRVKAAFGRGGASVPVQVQPPSLINSSAIPAGADLSNFTTPRHTRQISSATTENSDTPSKSLSSIDELQKSKRVVAKPSPPLKHGSQWPVDREVPEKSLVIVNNTDEVHIGLAFDHKSRNNRSKTLRKNFDKASKSFITNFQAYDAFTVQQRQHARLRRRTVGGGESRSEMNKFHCLVAGRSDQQAITPSDAAKIDEPLFLSLRFQRLQQERLDVRSGRNFDDATQLFKTSSSADKVVLHTFAMRGGNRFLTVISTDRSPMTGLALDLHTSLQLYPDSLYDPNSLYTDFFFRYVFEVRSKVRLENLANHKIEVAQRAGNAVILAEPLLGQVCNNHSWLALQITTPKALEHMPTSGEALKAARRTITLGKNMDWRPPDDATFLLKTPATSNPSQTAQVHLSNQAAVSIQRPVTSRHNLSVSAPLFPSTPVQAQTILPLSSESRISVSMQPNFGMTESPSVEQRIPMRVPPADVKANAAVVLPKKTLQQSKYATEPDVVWAPGSTVAPSDAAATATTAPKGRIESKWEHVEEDVVPKNPTRPALLNGLTQPMRTERGEYHFVPGNPLVAPQDGEVQSAWANQPYSAEELPKSTASAQDSNPGNIMAVVSDALGRSNNRNGNFLATPTNAPNNMTGYASFPPNIPNTPNSNGGYRSFPRNDAGVPSTTNGYGNFPATPLTGPNTPSAFGNFQQTTASSPRNMSQPTFRPAAAPANFNSSNNSSGGRGRGNGNNNGHSGNKGNFGGSRSGYKRF